ncbi:MAG: hypothetical protein C3F13_19200 [Anaerolineales bacterium]|nr:hypothetical protein [Anaerolineae bacterium]PWB49528.1 MAG: hypothetical protein C3F13_19200 [Anaerolineales bacterium]
MLPHSIPSPEIKEGMEFCFRGVVFTHNCLPCHEAAGRQLRAAVDAMQPCWLSASRILLETKGDILSYMSFPIEHWKRIYSNNILKRLDMEVKRRTNVEGIFPDEASVIRLVGGILQKHGTEWE